MFYYKKGEIIHTRPWNRPTPEKFEQWLKEWKKLEGLNDYDVYLTGGFCQNYFLNKNLKTWDIDLFLTNDFDTIEDYKVLKNLLIEGIKIGFKYDLLIDIYWRNKIPTINEFPDKKIITYTEITKKSIIENWTEKVRGTRKELIPGLYLVELEPKRAYNKFKSKNYELVCKKLL